MTKDSKAGDAELVALSALAWVAADDDRLDRFLALSGISIDELRASAGSPALLGALMGHLCNHEPDLLACAEALDMKPQALAAAARGISGGYEDEF